MLPFVVNNLDRLLNAATAMLRDSGCSFTFRDPWLVGSDYLVTLLPAAVEDTTSDSPLCCQRL